MIQNQIRSISSHQRMECNLPTKLIVSDYDPTANHFGILFREVLDPFTVNLFQFSDQRSVKLEVKVFIDVNSQCRQCQIMW